MTEKYVFNLYNINISLIEKKYDLMPFIVNEKVSSLTELDTIPSNLIDTVKNDNNKVTNITDLCNGIQKVISFLDESKKKHNCNILMIDFKTKEKINDTSKIDSNYSCYWCRNPFSTIPIGCPIKYIPSQAKKKYYSQISKDYYTIKESLNDLNIQDRIKKSIENIEVENINSKVNTIIINENKYYETDGIFCSFNCCKSFILDNKHNILYTNSIILLYKLYYDLTGEVITTIMNAPDWRLLKEYGGYLTISQFRDSLNKINYENYGIIKNFKSIGILVEEKFKF
jgi:hypothetical protein